VKKLCQTVEHPSRLIFGDLVARTRAEDSLRLFRQVDRKVAAPFARLVSVA